MTPDRIMWVPEHGGYSARVAGRTYLLTYGAPAWPPRPADAWVLREAIQTEARHVADLVGPQDDAPLDAAAAAIRRDADRP